MKVLAADDDRICCTLLDDLLQRWGYETVLAHNGNEAWDILQDDNPPSLAILDWIMPGMDGTEVCRKARDTERLKGIHLIILTAKGHRDDIVAGLQAGANDYITKPFNKEELRIRLEVGRRVVELQSELAVRVRELEDCLAHIKTLQGIVPICSYCKKIRDDQSYWQQVESYISKYTNVQFSHGVCPECWEKHMQPQLDRLRK